MTAGFSIDAMELADIGHPRSLARAIHEQVRAQLGGVPLKFPLEELAKQVGIVAVEVVDTDKFDGLLIVQNGKGVVAVRRQRSRQRMRFTIGHEIGHFLIPTHLGGKYRFECSRADMGRVRPNQGRLSDVSSAHIRKEIEANEFAATLLVPQSEFQRERKALGEEDDLAHVKLLAEMFDVSREMMARVYVERSDGDTAIVISKEGRVAQVITPKGFPFMGLFKGGPLPAASLSSMLLRRQAPGVVSDRTSIDRYIWFDEQQPVSSVREQVSTFAKGIAMTMLSVRLFSRDENDDDLLTPTDRMWDRSRSGRFAWDE